MMYVPAVGRGSRAGRMTHVLAVGSTRGYSVQGGILMPVLGKIHFPYSQSLFGPRCPFGTCKELASKPRCGDISLH